MTRTSAELALYATLGRDRLTAAMNRFKAVARIRQRAVHDGGERVSEITLFQRLAEPDFLNVGRLGGNQLFTHEDLASRLW